MERNYLKFLASLFFMFSFRILSKYLEEKQQLIQKAIYKTAPSTLGPLNQEKNRIALIISLGPSYSIYFKRILNNFKIIVKLPSTTINDDTICYFCSLLLQRTSCISCLRSVALWITSPSHRCLSAFSWTGPGLVSRRS